MSTLDDYQALYTDALLRRLPPGDAEIWRADVMQLLCRTLATDAARVRLDVDAWIDGFLPDSALEFLPEWEALLALTPDGLTTDERRAQIIARLRGNVDPTLTNIEAQLQTLKPAARMTHLQHMPPAVGAEAAAQLQTEQAVATVCYMDQAFTGAGVDPDDTSYATLVTSPLISRTGGQVGRYGGSSAYRYTWLAASYVRFDVASTVEDVRVAFWVRKTSAAGSMTVYFEHLVSGSTWSAGDPQDISTSWQQIVYTIPAGTAGAFRIRAAGSMSANLVLSNMLAGVRDSAFEVRVADLLTVPLHSTIEFATIGEYDT